MELPEFICCPRCKSDLHAQTEVWRINPEPDSPQCYTCTKCALEYPSVDGVVDFLPEGNGEKKRGQKLMEAEWVVEIYDSKWWRGCKLFSVFAGINLDEEISLVKKITNPGTADVVLDLACGPGIFARAFAEGNPARKVFGCDLSRSMLRYANKKAKKLGIQNITFMHGDAHSLPFKDCSVDVASCGGALHLFKDVRQVLGELHRIIKPNGRFSAAMAMVRPSSFFSRLKAYLDEKYWGIHYFREQEIKELLNEAGFEPTIHHSRGLWMIAGGTRRT